MGKGADELKIYFRAYKEKKFRCDRLPCIRRTYKSGFIWMSIILLSLTVLDQVKKFIT